MHVFVLLIVVFHGAVLPTDVSAQAVQGRTLDAGNRRPIEGAVVRLLDSAGDTVSATASDSTGSFRLALSEPGRFRLRSDGLGYRAKESSTFEAPAEGDTLTFDLLMEPNPIPVRGIEISADQTNRRLRQFFGMSPGQLRIRPIRASVIDDHISRGHDLTEMMRWIQIPNLQILRSRDGPCYQFRGRGCLPVYLDGTRMTQRAIPELPLEMLNTVVVLLPSETTAYPSGAVHLFSTGFIR